jgi:hypothetical protein
MNWLCTVPIGTLQWAASGSVLALVLFGFSLGMRQGYKMGRRAQATLDTLKERVSTRPTKPAA